MLLRYQYHKQQYHIECMKHCHISLMLILLAFPPHLLLRYIICKKFHGTGIFTYIYHKKSTVNVGKLT